MLHQHARTCTHAVTHKLLCLIVRDPAWPMWHARSRLTVPQGKVFRRVRCTDEENGLVRQYSTKRHLLLSRVMLAGKACANLVILSVSLDCQRPTNYICRRHIPCDATPCTSLNSQPAQPMTSIINLRISIGPGIITSRKWRRMQEYLSSPSHTPPSSSPSGWR